MRPDRIVIGEVRGGEALDMLQAMNTGHDGSISTLHANNPRDALSRLETMVLMAGMELPLKAVREQISSAIELVIHQTRFSDGSRRITQISEVVGIKDDSICSQDIFVFQQTGIDELGHVQGSHIITGIVPRCLEKLKACGEFIDAEGIIPEWNRDRETPSVPQLSSLEAENESKDGKALSGQNESVVVSYMLAGAPLLGLSPAVELSNVISMHPEVDFQDKGQPKNMDTGAQISVSEGKPEQNDRHTVSSVEWSDTFSSTKEKNSQRLSLYIPPGMRGIAIPVNKATGLFSYLTPGDRVDVLVIYGEKDSNGQTSASIAVRNALVLAAGNNGGKEPAEMFPDSTVLLAVTPEQAQTLACDCLKGSFHLTLCPGS
jgi:hypothetical protein